MIENINEIVGTDYSQKKQMLDTLKLQPNCFVGWVDSFDVEKGTINVQPAIQDQIYDEDQALVWKNKPFLVNVWVAANTLGRNPQRGDKALIWVLDEKSNNFFKSQFNADLPIENQTMVNNSKAYKTISNCVAIIINSSVGGGGGGLPLGLILPRAVYKTDASMYPLDGTTIEQDGLYSNFCKWLKDLISEDPASVPTCRQAEFDTIVATYGQCGCFVIDDEAGTIRVPKITKFIEGLSDISELGKIIEAGLPNIEGSYAAYVSDNNNATAPFSFTNRGAQTNITTGSNANHVYTLNFDASQANSIYGNSDTVQPEAIKYPYYIVVSTGMGEQFGLDVTFLIETIEHLTDTPDVSKAGLVGTPNVKFIDNIVNGEVYKKFEFSYLKGEPGEKGEQGERGSNGANGKDGEAATIQVGTVTTLDPGSDATVTNVGTDTNAILDFGIPQGDVNLIANPVTLGTTWTNQNDTVIEYWVASDGNTWYRKWASGWKECGGTKSTNNESATVASVVYPLSMTKILNIQLNNGSEWSTGSRATVCAKITSSSTSGFSFYSTYGLDGGGNYPQSKPYNWYVIGY